MKIRLFKDEPPLCFNLEKWGINNIPILLVTGLSGSGKTTFAKKYALQHKAVCISFDVLKFYPQSSIESQQILNLFLKQYPDIQQFIDIQWSKTDKQNSNDIFFNYYCNVFFDFIVEYSSKSAGLPLIIIRNSCLHSFCNKLRRDHFNHSGNRNRWYYSIKIIFKDIYIYYMIQYHYINNYIVYLATIS